MKKLLLVLAACCLLGACSRTEQPVTLRVMTYNIAAARLSSLEELGAYILSRDCDLVLLQEVDSMTRREGYEWLHDKNFMDTLARLTGLHPLYGQAIDFAGGKYGVGMLSRWPYGKVRKTFLPKADPQEETRVLLEAQIPLSERDTLVLACTHIEYSSPETRVPQIATVDRLARENRHPVLLGGDFNALADSPEMAPMSAWQRLSGSDFTYNAEEPSFTIDYLLGFPAGRWTLLQTEVDGQTLSDHRPVISTVQLTNLQQN